MKQLYNDVRQAADDLNNIKEAIISNGVEVPQGTKSSEYAGKINDVYQKGLDAGASGEGYSEGYEAGLADGYNNGHEAGFVEGEAAICEAILGGEW